MRTALLAVNKRFGQVLETVINIDTTATDEQAEDAAVQAAREAFEMRGTEPCPPEYWVAEVERDSATQQISRVVATLKKADKPMLDAVFEDPASLSRLRKLLKIDELEANDKAQAASIETLKAKVVFTEAIYAGRLVEKIAARCKEILGREWRPDAAGRVQSPKAFVDSLTQDDRNKLLAHGFNSNVLALLKGVFGDLEARHLVAHWTPPAAAATVTSALTPVDKVAEAVMVKSLQPKGQRRVRFAQGFEALYSQTPEEAERATVLKDVDQEEVEG